LDNRRNTPCKPPGLPSAAVMQAGVQPYRASWVCFGRLAVQQQGMLRVHCRRVLPLAPGANDVHCLAADICCHTHLDLLHPTRQQQPLSCRQLHDALVSVRCTCKLHPACKSLGLAAPAALKQHQQASPSPQQAATLCCCWCARLEHPHSLLPTRWP
jgi:hypothetical protein